MSTAYEEFINQVKKTIQEQPIPPKYNPGKWKDKRFNCYAYALRLFMDLSSYDTCIRPGFISRGEQNDYRRTKECTLQYFKDNCGILGLEVVPTSLEEEISKDAYKIAVYIMEKRDFHFARQDSNGKWSEKDGWGQGIKKLNEDEVSRDQGDYKFIGIFKISKKAE